MNCLSRIYIILISALFTILQAQLVKALAIDQVKKIGEEITVLIPQTYIGINGESKQANGSGSIIAQQGNTYTVLTAKHVVCKDPADKCLNYYDLKIVTHDKREYEVDPSAIKKLPGVDLALLQFKSDSKYQLATLGNYQLADEQFIFASGWPDPKFIGQRERFFSVGKVLPTNIMPLFKIFPSSLGYETVYTSVTYGGMSGGPVLDTEGRVIAVHGQNEGESIEGVRVYIGFSVAIPISTFIKLAPKAEFAGHLNVETSLPLAPSLSEIGDQFYEFFEAPNPQNTDPLDWINQGNKMWRSGQLALAYSAYEKALKLNPNLYQAWYGQGLVLTYWKRPQEAIAAYEKALQINPNADLAKKLRDKLQEFLGSASPSNSLPPASDQSEPKIPPTDKPGTLW